MIARAHGGIARGKLFTFLLNDSSYQIESGFQTRLALFYCVVLLGGDSNHFPGFPQEILENGHFVPGGTRQDAAPRYPNKKIWAEILLISDEACFEYVRRMCNDFEKAVKPDSTKKDKEWGLELGVSCNAAAAAAAFSLAVGCCCLLLLVVLVWRWPWWQRAWWLLYGLWFLSPRLAC